jgi:hypothetical protein
MAVSLLGEGKLACNAMLPGLLVPRDVLCSANSWMMPKAGILWQSMLLPLLLLNRQVGG